MLDNPGARSYTKIIILSTCGSVVLIAPEVKHEAHAHFMSLYSENSYVVVEYLT